MFDRQVKTVEMHPTAVRCSHTHGSASRRRGSFATAKMTKKSAPAVTPAEKNTYHPVLESAKVIEAA